MLIGVASMQPRGLAIQAWCYRLDVDVIDRIVDDVLAENLAKLISVVCLDSLCLERRFRET